MTDDKIPTPESIGYSLTVMEDLGLVDTEYRKQFKPKASGLKIDDEIILNPESADRLFGGIDGEDFKKIHQNNVVGKIIRLELQNNHYCFGEYAIVKWENGFEVHIHTSWLQLK